MKLISLECRVPDFAMSQRDMLAALQNSRAWDDLRDGSRQLLLKVLSGDSGIDKRHFACSELNFLHRADGGVLCELFENFAPKLGTRALLAAVEAARLRPHELDALLVCTCTGYLCPGLSSHIAEQAGLAPCAKLFDLAGQGCGAAVPLLSLAESLTINGAERVACVAVELSSAAFYIDDDAGVLISLCLFADGAAACVCTGDTDDSHFLAKLGGFRHLHSPGLRGELRFVNCGGKLRNILRPGVPELVAEAVERIFPELLNTSGDFTLLAHPGGRKVLERLGEKFPLARLSHSQRVLRDFGNMSSPSVLFVLRDWLDTGTGSEAVAVAYGAGFSAHGFRVRKSDGSGGDRTHDQLVKSQLLYH